MDGSEIAGEHDEEMKREVTRGRSDVYFERDEEWKSCRLLYFLLCKFAVLYIHYFVTSPFCNFAVW